MSVPSAELTAPHVGARGRAPVTALADRLTGGRIYLAMAFVALVVGALSLLIPSTPSYDPWAWLVWGREIVHLDLQTTGGPTWKPLPVIFTTLFAPFGKAAPDLWLVVGRAGAVMAVAMTFKLCMRFARQLSLGWELGAGVAERALGWAPALLAGVVASIGLIFAGGYITANALGYSEGLMTAIVLIAVERHLDGEPRQAFVVGFFAALDRPEIWLFWGPYGLWLAYRDPGARKLVIALFALIPVLWFLPEYWGSGHFFRGVNRAQHVRSNSPALAKCPFCTELGKHAWPTVPSRIKVAALAGIAGALFLLWRALRARGPWRQWRLQGPREHALAAMAAAGILGFAWWILIAIMTQAGFSGNDRYLVLGAALIEICGGVAWAWAAIEIGRYAPRFVRGVGAAGLRLAVTATVAAVFLLFPSWIGGLVHLSKTHRALNYQALLRTDAQAAIDRLGGPGAVLRCGSVMTEGFQVPMIAYYLGVHTLAIGAPPTDVNNPGPAPNVVLQVRAQRNAHLLPLLRSWPTTHFQRVATTRTFRVYESCRV